MTSVLGFDVRDQPHGVAVPTLLITPQDDKLLGEHAARERVCRKPVRSSCPAPATCSGLRIRPCSGRPSPSSSRDIASAGRRDGGPWGGLEPAPHTGDTADRTAVDRALGALLEQGWLPTAGRRELRRRAGDAGASLVQAAADVLAALPGGSPLPKAPRRPSGDEPPTAPTAGQTTVTPAPVLQAA